MTQICNPLYDEPAKAVAVSSNLDERMTVLELAVGTALWAHGRVKIPRDALTRVCLDLRNTFGDERSNLLSSTTYGEFYSGQVGAPRTAHLPAADQIPKAFRNGDFGKNLVGQAGPEDYRDGSCV